MFTNYIDQEHATVKSAAQVNENNIATLRLSTTQIALMKTLSLLIVAGKYSPQGYRTALSFHFDISKGEVIASKQWWQNQCAIPVNKSTQTYPLVIVSKSVNALYLAKVIIATSSLVSHGPHP